MDWLSSPKGYFFSESFEVHHGDTSKNFGLKQVNRLFLPKSSRDEGMHRDTEMQDGGNGRVTVMCSST